jgi:hypothetical protein
VLVYAWDLIYLRTPSATCCIALRVPMTFVPTNAVAVDIAVAATYTKSRHAPCFA